MKAAREFLEHLRLNENASAAHRSRLRERPLAVPRLPRQACRPHADRADARRPRPARRSARSSATCRSAAISQVVGRAQAGGDPDLRAATCAVKGVIEDDPAALVGTPKREQRLPGAPRRGGDDALLEMPDTSHPLGRRDRAILELFYASGLRLSELVGLDIDDVNLSGRIVRVLGQGTEGAAGAVQPLDRDGDAGVAEGLGGARSGAAGATRGRPRRAARAKTRSRGDPLFLNYAGGRLSTRSVDRLVRKYVAACSTRFGISPHALRHSFATHLLSAAPTCARSRSCSGHARLSTTQRYTHVNAAQLIEAYKKGAPESVGAQSAARRSSLSYIVLAYSSSPSSAGGRRARNRCRAS